MNQYKIFASLGEMQSSSNLSYLSLTSLDYSMYDASPCHTHPPAHHGTNGPSLCAQWRSGASADLQVADLDLLGTYAFSSSSCLQVVLSTPFIGVAACVAIDPASARALLRHQAPAASLPLRRRFVLGVGHSAPQQAGTWRPSQYSSLMHFVPNNNRFTRIALSCSVNASSWAMNTPRCSTRRSPPWTMSQCTCAVSLREPPPVHSRCASGVRTSTGSRSHRQKIASLRFSPARPQPSD